MIALRPPEFHVSRFRRSPNPNLLAIESERVLHVAEIALQRLLGLIPGIDDTLQPHAMVTRATPVLTLRLFPRPEDRVMVDAERVQALSAFGQLIVHWRRLDAFLEIKHAFWYDILRSRAPFETTSEVSKSALRDPAFPIFAIDFRDHTYAYNPNTPSPYESLEDTLVSFFTTPSMLEPTADRQEHVQLAVELNFAHTRPMSVSALEALERTLDRTFAHPTRQFTVSALDLSGNRMNPAKLAVVARIAHKCRYVYHVPELRLGDIIPNCGNVTPPEFLDIMRAAYGFTRPPVLTAVDVGKAPAVLSDIPPAHSTLRSVSLKGNWVCPMYFAALFSALRYGSPVEEDFSQYVETSTKGMSECRSWLAFGLFYPRPKRFAKLLHLRNVGCLVCTAEIVEAFTKTLRNPATQLVYRGRHPSRTNSAARELLVCTVKKGASVELIEPLRPEGPNRSSFGSASVKLAPTQLRRHEIGAQCELEGLCERESDGAVCVVIPGVGLGWVQRDSLVHIERESLESAWKHQDGRYTIQLKCNDSYTGKEAIRAMITLLGRQIRSLSFNCYRIKTIVMPHILQHCPHLRHLNLQFLNVAKSDVVMVVDALRSSPLRTRLLSLNLNGSSFLASIDLTRLAALLLPERSSGVRLALRELRLHGVLLSMNAIMALHNGLSTNRELRLLQLMRVDHHSSYTLSVEQKLLCRTHDDELLQLVLPMASKLAFLSTVFHAKSAESHRSLDENLVELIFRFANGRDVRRSIALASNSRCTSY